MRASYVWAVLVKEVRDLLSNRLPIKYENDRPTIPESLVRTYAAPNQAVIRVLFKSGVQWAATDRAPDFGKLGLRPGKTGEVGGWIDCKS